MIRRKPARAPFVVTVALAASAAAAGCGGSVAGEGGNPSECPAALPSDGSACGASPLACEYPSGTSCGMANVSTASCVAGAWDVAHYGSTCNPPPPSLCPSSPPPQGGFCSQVGQRCEFEGAVDECGQTSQTTAECSTSYQWEVSTAAVSCNPPPPGCPATEPTIGSACADGPSTFCDYPSLGCCPATYSCQGGTWQQLPSSCNPPPLLCPSAPPATGDACSPCALGSCEWDSCDTGGGLLQGQCSPIGAWTVQAAPCPG